MEDVEPILIFAYDEEAERGVPVTDEDMYGTLEKGWVLAALKEPRAATPGLGRTVWTMDTRREVHRVSDGWLIRTAACDFPAIKFHLSADEVVCVKMRFGDLKPGMVFSYLLGFCVFLPGQRLRELGSRTKWGVSVRRLSEMEVAVCCTRPSMQFILK